MTTKTNNIEEVTNDFKNLFKKKPKKSPSLSYIEHPKLKPQPIKHLKQPKLKPEPITDLEKTTSKQNDNEISSYDLRKNLAISIKKLEEYEIIQVFHIIKNAGENYSQNKSGVFFDLLILKEETINTLNEFLKSTTAYRK